MRSLLVETCVPKPCFSRVWWPLSCCVFLPDPSYQEGPVHLPDIWNFSDFLLLSVSIFVPSHRRVRSTLCMSSVLFNVLELFLSQHTTQSGEFSRMPQKHVGRILLSLSGGVSGASVRRVPLLSVCTTLSAHSMQGRQWGIEDTSHYT